jgi:hypothetical protein
LPKLRWYLNLPHKFLRPRLFIPVESIYSINNRLRKTISNTRYLQFIIYFIYDITLVLPALHSLWGLSKMIVSIILIGYCPLPYWLCPLFLKHGLPQELILLSCPAIFFYFRIRYIR